MSTALIPYAPLPTAEQFIQQIYRQERANRPTLADFSRLKALANTFFSDEGPLNLTCNFLTQRDLARLSSTHLSMRSTLVTHLLYNQTNCLPYLEEVRDRLAKDNLGFPQLAAAIREKKSNLRREALTLSVEELRSKTLSASRGSIEQADLYEMFKIKEAYLNEESRKSTVDLERAFLATCGRGIHTTEQLQTAIKNGKYDATQAAYKDFIEICARKWADGAEGLANIQWFVNRSNEADTSGNIVSQTILRLAAIKITAKQRSVKSIERLALDDNQILEEGRRQKIETDALHTMCETINALNTPDAGVQLREDPLSPPRQKYSYYLALANELTIEALRANLESTRNPVRKEDLIKAIRIYYAHNYAYCDLRRLSEQNPTDSYLSEAFNIKNQHLKVLSDSPRIELERLYLRSAPGRAHVGEAAADEPHLVEFMGGRHLPRQILIFHAEIGEALRRYYSNKQTLERLWQTANDPEKDPLLTMLALDVFNQRMAQLCVELTRNCD